MTIEVGNKVICIWNGEEWEAFEGYVPELGETVLCKNVDGNPKFALVGIGSFEVGDILTVWPGGLTGSFGFEFPPFAIPPIQYYDDIVYPHWLTSVVSSSNVGTDEYPNNGPDGCLGVEPYPGAYILEGGHVEAAWDGSSLRTVTSVTVREQTGSIYTHTFNPNDYIYPTKYYWNQNGEIGYISFKYPNIIRVEVPSGASTNSFEFAGACINY